jgi:hypothetical protein
LVADLAAARAEAAAGLATIERPVIGVPHRAT